MVANTVIAQLTCPAAFQSGRKMIQASPKRKATTLRIRISSGRPNVRKAQATPIRITMTSQTSEMM